MGRESYIPGMPYTGWQGMWTQTQYGQPFDILTLPIAQTGNMLTAQLGGGVGFEPPAQHETAAQCETAV